MTTPTPASSGSITDQLVIALKDLRDASITQKSASAEAFASLLVAGFARLESRIDRLEKTAHDRTQDA